MRTRLFILPILGLLLTGCEEAREQRFCTAIAVDALTVTVKDGATGQRICDATVVAIDGAFSADLRGFALGLDCTYSGPTERPGRYEVRVTRAGYEAAVRPGVTVTADECHVIPVRLAVDLVPSAAP
jgi:hypothetical protein